MNRRAILLVCALLAVLAAASLVASRKIFDDRYIDSTEVEKSFTEDNALRMALKKIKVEEGDQPEDILNNIAAIPYVPQTFESIIYSSLWNMANPGEGCGSLMINHVLAMSVFFNDDQDSLASFVESFLVHYGRLKFVSCTKEAIEEFDNESYQPFESHLNLFFEALLNVQNLASIKYAAMEELRSLDLRSDTLHFCNALKLVKQIYSHDGESSDMRAGSSRGKLSYLKIGGSKKLDDAFKIFSGFLTETCDGFKRGRRDAINIVALALAFTRASRTTRIPEEFGLKRVQKVLEYSRVCLSYARSDMREAIDRNIKKQLKKC